MAGVFGKQLGRLESIALYLLARSSEMLCNIADL